MTDRARAKARGRRWSPTKCLRRTIPVAPSDGALADDTVLDGILGDRLRVRVITTGTYVNSVVSVRAAVR